MHSLLEFMEAFDRIAHRCPFRLLTRYGFSTKFMVLIEGMYVTAFSSIHINGHTTGPIPIRCSVRRGCAMSMMLFALCLNPLQTLLDQRLTGIRIGRTRAMVLAYADDIALFLTTPADIQHCVQPYGPMQGQPVLA
jgi:hypothetical protein